MDAVSQTFSHLAQLPNIGSTYKTGNSRLTGLRKWSVKGFNKNLVFYLEGDNCIEVVRLLHSSRDISQILTEE